MKAKYLILILLFYAALIKGQTSIRIDASKPGAKVSQNLYGIFFEEINHAGEGGIYGELIRNRGFEENRLPEDMFRKGNMVCTKNGWIHYYLQPDSIAGWSLSLSGAAKGYIRQTSDNPLNSKNPMNLKLVAEIAGNGFEVINEGFWGISVIKDDKYILSLYVRAEKSYKGDIKVMLKSRLGKILASETLGGITDKWKKLSCILTPGETDPKAVFVISPCSEGTLYFDMVSMFPAKTFKNHPNGLRFDLANLINEFKPGFIRFPGGCIVEGATLENRIKWENTIGDIAERPGHWVLWNYHSTDGLGLHEFLQFCEDLGCPAMYVIPVGMSCQFRFCEYVESENLEPYIAEVLNALEYALGPVTSKWGAERAKNGHPEPFNLKYLEIGNENYGPVYQDHYNTFFQAIKKKYPQLITITCTDPGMRDVFNRKDLPGINQSIEMIDEHFYESPDFFFRNAYRYDSYDRNGPKVYVGEYAVKKWDNTLKGNLEAALAEAAFMTGFERNADIVKLSSQAPTFVNVNDRNWNPDLIAYNSSQCYGSPSYVVQKLFSNNLPDYMLPTEVQNSGYTVDHPQDGTGMIGFTNPGNLCMYKDIIVTINDKIYNNKQLFTDDVLNLQKDGIWRVKGSQYIDLTFRPEIYKEAGTKDWNNYTLSLKAYAEKIGDIEGFTIMFYTTGKNKYYKWNIGRWLRYYWLQWYDNGYESYFGQQPGSIEPGRWYDISITYRNDSVLCSLDGKRIHAVKAPDKVIPGIYATSGINANGDIIVKIVNPSGDSRDVDFVIDNSSGTYRKVHSMIISGEGSDENTFNQPFHVSPKSLDFTIPGNTFHYTFIPRSVNVFTIKK